MATSLPSLFRQQYKAVAACEDEAGSANVPNFTMPHQDPKNLRFRLTASLLVVQQMVPRLTRFGSLERV